MIIDMVYWVLCLAAGFCGTEDTDPLGFYDPTPAEAVSELPFDWPDKHDPYLFNPWTYYQNAAYLCRSHNPELADELFEFAMSHVEDGLVVYGYSYDFEGSMLEPGWISGFGNGVALAATSALYECYGNVEYAEAAKELFEAYPAFTTDLGNGMSWFEEYPVKGSRVLNGHIYGVWGLHYYWHATGDFRALIPLEKGLEAVAVHGWDYRRPGQINLYDLSGPDTEDYGPARAIHQQDQLCLMTGDERFRELRDAFAIDMPEHNKPYDDCDVRSVYDAGGLELN